MGKKKKASSNLGRSLVKDRFGGTSNRKIAGDSLLHTAEINDGYDWGRLNLQSVTEESSFQEFLSTAELAGTEFQAEKLNITFVTQTSGLLSKLERAKVEAKHKQHKSLLSIPRRPKWNAMTTGEQLQEQERNAFLEWRHGLAILQEDKGLVLTPYEKNLEFWRQLWRVVEKSDVVVQIVDARNPLLFRCDDLEKYVKEVDEKKLNLLLLNKADLLTEQQRETWTEYFNQHGIRVAFFSAVLEDKKDDVSSEESAQEEQEDDDEDDDDHDEDESEEDTVTAGSTSDPSPETKPAADLPHNPETKAAADLQHNKEVKPTVTKETNVKESITGLQLLSDNKVCNSSHLLSRQDLIDLFKTFSSPDKPCTCIGLVGYPNVGKSSTINALLQQKKVSVSTTPGKTKHFQTLFLEPTLMLCDCPGLVMPSFVCTKADMVVNGILPVDQLRDHVPPIGHVASVIPRHVLEDKYGIMLPPPREGEDPSRPPTAEELLSAYAYNRGFMTQRGLPDNSRGARCILKEFVAGKLLYCLAPPGYSQEEFHPFPARLKAVSERQPPQLRVVRPHKMSTETLDKAFFSKASIGAHVKGKTIPSTGAGVSSEASSSTDRLAGKPWKKHNNRNKKEKLRRVYAHLDQN